MNESLENNHILQQMVFQSKGGELLRDLFIEAGHFYSELETTEHMVEQNLIKRLMQSCGMTIEFKPKVLPDHTEGPNVIDDILEDTPDE